MKRFLGVLVAVGASAIVAGGAVAQMEHGSGHGMHGATAKAGEASHEMNCPMAKAGHDMMKNHMSKAGHDMMKNHMSKAGHEMQSPTGQADHK
jgi:hypothetical protein